MIDITKNEEDKDKFITKIFLKDDENSFVVNYASGRQEIRDFTVDDLNTILLEMEKQYLRYRDEYVLRINKENVRITLRKMIEALIAVATLYLTSVIAMPTSLKILIIMILVIYTISYQKNQTDLLNENRYGAQTILTADEFLKHKEDFKIRIIDPNTGLESDWYLLTLSDIEKVFEPKLVSKLASGLSSEAKEEQGEITTEILQKRMKLG